jgi:L-seryl-tRNA(Ser) seleniumtransferase
MSKEKLRQLPSVDRLLGEETVQQLVAAYGHDQTVDALRATLDAARDEVRAGTDAPSPEMLAARTSACLQERLAPSLRPAINATGVIIHTNLGRAPLSAAARAAVEAVARGYSTLEYDLDAGQRGHRTVHAEQFLRTLTGAESALVVNNNAGAMLLALSGLAQGKGAIVSRGQLVEIGGGFRVPDVMAQSGARLIEVGTTNRTHLRDYEQALEANDDVALILRAHHSNFRIVGFTIEPSLAELAALGAERGLPVLDDLGSGALLDTARYGLAHEPTVQESVAAGAGVVCFSGDKLLGGPQAGVIVGKAEYVEPFKHHPLARALRADKLCLACLQATLLHYLKGEAAEQVPIWRMIATPLEEIEQRARRWRRALRQAGVEAEIVDGASTVGGGSLPGETLPTKLVALATEHPNQLAAALRVTDPPIIARIEEDRLVLDPRTVLAEEEQHLIGAIKKTRMELLES